MLIVDACISVNVLATQKGNVLYYPSEFGGKMLGNFGYIALFALVAIGPRSGVPPASSPS